MQPWAVPNKMNKVQRTLTALFRRSKASRTSEHSTDYQSLQDAAGGLDAEYRRLVTEHLRRWGVPEKCATVDVRGDGRLRGREGFVATITVQSWDRDPVLRLMLGLPLLEKKIRKAIEGQWIADMSRFEGLLLKTAPGMQGRQPTQELRHLLVSLTGTRASQQHPDSDDSSVSP